MTREEAIEILRNYDDLVWQEENKVTMGMVADAIRMGEEALQSPWKSVKEELPKDKKSKVVITRIGNEQSVKVARYNSEYGDWINEYCAVYGVTHWMPIPELPKED